MCTFIAAAASRTAGVRSAVTSTAGMVVKAMNTLRVKQDAKVDAQKAPEIPADVKLLSEIRDLLAARKTA